MRAGMMGVVMVRRLDCFFVGKKGYQLMLRR
jgi:hypothetical protein